MAGKFKNGKMTNAPTVTELKESMQFILRASSTGAGS
jgi:hypothetical protein